MTPVKASVRHIAEAAGVSTATVDRVLNGRDGVSPAKRKRVLEAARDLGSRRVPASPSAYRLRVLVIRTGIDDEYFMRLEAALDAVAASSQPQIELKRLIRVPSATLKSVIREESQHCHGVLVLAHDGGELRLALRSALKKKLPVLSLTSDLGQENQSAYIGIDNLAAGRTAAWLVSRLVPATGRVLLMTGSQTYQVHRERTQGFKQGLATWGPRLKLVGPTDVDDLDDKAEHELRAAIKRYGRLAAVYNSGGANEGVRHVLADMREADRPVWITHEASPRNEALLQQGLITTLIDQRPELQARVGLETILHHYGERAAAPSPLIDLRIVTPGNL